MSRKSRAKTGRSKTDEDWRRYELAMFKEQYYTYRPPQFVVLPDYREIEGLITEGKRQIDVVVLDANNATRPFIAVESKFYSRKVDVKAVEAFVGMQQDIERSTQLWLLRTDLVTWHCAEYETRTSSLLCYRLKKQIA